MGLFEYPMRNEGEKAYLVERSYSELVPNYVKNKEPVS